MKHAFDEPVATPPALISLYAPIETELARFEAFLSTQLESDFPFVDQLVKHGFRLGGKRLRPALVLLSAKASGTVAEAHVHLAAVVELIHTATLVHDDVLDEALVRRHLDTVNARWNNETSVLLGDYLFTLALRVVASLEDSYAARAIGEASRVMCEGELRQIANRGNYSLGEPEYLEIIAAKTAALTACCCQIGAHYAGAEASSVERLAAYGQKLGVAFQIADDLLDLVGDEGKVGKSLGTDLVKQKLTLPMIRLLGSASSEHRQTVIEQLGRSDNHRRELLRPWLERYDTFAYARGKAEAFIAGAVDELSCLPESPARESLAAIARFTLERQQ